MLVISLKEREQAVLADRQGNVLGFITLTQLQPSKARIGFQLPPEVKIYRPDVWTAMGRELPRIGEKVEV